MRDLRRRLEEAAAKWEPVEAGRQHAQCKPSEEPARTAESDMAVGELIRVGPTESVKTLAAAASQAKDGAVIEIADGNYEGGTVTWTQDDLTLRGRHGRPRLRLTGPASGSAVWVLRGSRTVVENMAFVGPATAVPDGTAIRLEGGDLTVRGSAFRGNETAIAVTGNGAGREVLISSSEFGGAGENDAGEEAGANRLDIGAIGKLTLEFSYLHGAPSAPGVTSHARVTRIDYNRIAAGTGGGRAQRLIDLPEGGTAEIVGNELENGGGVAPFAFVAFGTAAASAYRDSALYVLSNTFYNRTPGTAGVNIRLDAPALVANNVFAGAPMSPFTGRAEEGGNQSIGGVVAATRAATYELTRDSPAIDAAIDPLALDPAAPRVEFEYRHPGAGVARVIVWKPDAGAHEFCDKGLAPPPVPEATLPES